MPVDAPVIYAGDTVKLGGTGFKPGQQVQVLFQGQSVTGTPVAADAEGKLTLQTRIPADAEPGRHPMVISVTEPSATALLPLKVSPKVATFGADKFNEQAAHLVPGLYQVAYSVKNDVAFVTAAVGRPPVTRSELVKVNPATLEVIARVSAPPAPDRIGPDGKPQAGGVFAVYGVAVDDANGHVWTTNTRQNTVAVYSQKDLKLVKQFEPGEANHARDVVVDERTGLAFVSAAMNNEVVVFDVQKLQKVDTIKLQPSARGPRAEPFSVMSLALNSAEGKLFAVSTAGDVAVINTATKAVEKVLAIKGVASGAGVAYDARNNRVLVAGQGSDNLVIANADTGEVEHNIKVGGGTLNVAYNPVNSLAYVVNRGSGTITVVDDNGQMVANLPSLQPNHAVVTPDGTVFVVNKGREGVQEANSIRRIQLKK